MKKCSKCGEEKPLDEFIKNKRNPDGLEYKCKICLRAYRKRWRDANQDKVRRYHKKYDEANRDSRNLRDRERRRRSTLKNSTSSDKHTYLVSDGEFIKIGVYTHGKLRRRIRELQSGNPSKLKVLATSASNIEKLCHYEFEDLNVLNEWFKLDLRLITFFTEQAV